MSEIDEIKAKLVELKDENNKLSTQLIREKKVFLKSII